MFCMRTGRYRRCSRLHCCLISCIVVGIVLNLTFILNRSSFMEGLSFYATLIPRQLMCLLNSMLSNGGSCTMETDGHGNGTHFWFTKFNRHSEFLIQLKNRTCFKEGTYATKISSRTCYCKSGWYGESCSIPEVVFNSATPWKKESLVLRRNPRKIIQAFPFNMEFELVEMRFAETSDVVDVFLILESNFTAYGTPKELHFLKRLRNNAYPNVAHKIVHLFLDYFPEKARQDGWIAERLLRNHMGAECIKQIQGWEMSGLFVLTDADELPSREVLTFLKWHDGYTEPVSVMVHFSVYGFFWSSSYQEQGMPESNEISMCAIRWGCCCASFVSRSTTSDQPHSLCTNTHYTLSYTWAWVGGSISGPWETRR